MTYCADDVSATHAVYKKMWPQFKMRYHAFYVGFCYDLLC